MMTLIRSKNFCFVFVLNGDNCIVLVPAANGTWPKKLTDEQIKLIKSADVIMLQQVFFFILLLTVFILAVLIEC